MKCVCGHAEHDGTCTAPTMTEHFEGTNHGGIVPCGCVSYEPDDGTDGPSEMTLDPPDDNYWEQP